MFTVPFILIKPVLINYSFDIILFQFSLGRSHKTDFSINPNNLTEMNFNFTVKSLFIVGF